MKFSEKYELRESLTTGAVETFVANDKVRGERVLVHIVECAPQTSEQNSAAWALESFRKLAPEPPGPVLETGKYRPPKYAYVVVKPSDEAAIKAWVRRYELLAEETKETSVHTLKNETSPVSPTVAAPMAAKEPPQASGSMTQLFRDYDSLAKSKPSDAPTALDLPAVKPAPSTSMPGESGLHAAPSWDLAHAKPGVPATEPPFTTPPTSSIPVDPQASVPTGRNIAKPGEFTSFFQGPFRGDNPSGMPSFSSEPIEPPKKTVGEFTALFGQATPPSAAKPASPNASEPSFTSIFKDMGTQQAPFSAPPAVQGAIIPPAAPPVPSVPPVNVTPLPDPVFVAPTPVAPPNPSSAPAISVSPSAPVEKPVPSRQPLPGDGATGAFMHPTAEPAPAPAEGPSGPSPYTQIISRPKAAEPEEAEAAQITATSPAPGKFAAPSMPKIPPAAPPPMPKMPPPPKLAAPPVPKMKAPPAPKVPKIDAPAPPPVSMWPLIITLTVLFFLAVILVLYFVLRH
jgi:hypothetical protein